MLQDQEILNFNQSSSEAHPQRADTRKRTLGAVLSAVLVLFVTIPFMKSYAFSQDTQMNRSDSNRRALRSLMSQDSSIFNIGLKELFAVNGTVQVNSTGNAGIPVPIQNIYNVTFTSYMKNANTTYIIVELVALNISSANLSHPSSPSGSNGVDYDVNSQVSSDELNDLVNNKEKVFCQVDTLSGNITVCQRPLSLDKNEFLIAVQALRQFSPDLKKDLYIDSNDIRRLEQSRNERNQQRKLVDDDSGAYERSAVPVVERTFKVDEDNGLLNLHKKSIQDKFGDQFSNKSNQTITKDINHTIDAHTGLVKNSSWNGKFSYEPVGTSDLNEQDIVFQNVQIEFNQTLEIDLNSQVKMQTNELIMKLIVGNQVESEDVYDPSHNAAYYQTDKSKSAEGNVSSLIEANRILLGTPIFTVNNALATKELLGMQASIGQGLSCDQDNNCLFTVSCSVDSKSFQLYSKSFTSSISTFVKMIFKMVSFVKDLFFKWVPQIRTVIQSINTFVDQCFQFVINIMKNIQSAIDGLNNLLQGNIDYKSDAMALYNAAKYVIANWGNLEKNLIAYEQQLVAQFQQIPSKIGAFFKDNFNSVKGNIMEIVKEVSAYLDPNMPINITNTVDVSLSTFTPAGIQDMINKPFEDLKGLWSDITTLIPTTVKNDIQAIKNSFQGIKQSWSSLNSTFIGLQGKIQALWQKYVSAGTSSAAPSGTADAISQLNTINSASDHASTIANIQSSNEAALNDIQTNTIAAPISSLANNQQSNTLGYKQKLWDRVVSFVPDFNYNIYSLPKYSLGFMVPVPALMIGPVALSAEFGMSINLNSFKIDIGTYNKSVYVQLGVQAGLEADLGLSIGIMKYKLGIYLDGELFSLGVTARAAVNLYFVKPYTRWSVDITAHAFKLDLAIRVTYSWWFKWGYKLFRWTACKLFGYRMLGTTTRRQLAIMDAKNSIYQNQLAQRNLRIMADNSFIGKWCANDNIDWDNLWHGMVTLFQTTLYKGIEVGTKSYQYDY